MDARNNDYYGPGINRAARLLHVSYGGQVLISGTVASMLPRELPPQVSLFDLGKHRFRDVADTEQVYQLVAPGIKVHFRR